MSQISTALGLLREAQALWGPRILLGLSGGKDSLAVLVLACRVFGPENVSCYVTLVFDSEAACTAFLEHVGQPSDRKHIDGHAVADALGVDLES